MIPENLKYTQEHEWVKIEGDIAIVGVSDFAQEQLGEVTFVELPLVGQVVKVEDVIGAIESSKAASDLFSPVAGEIIEVNNSLEESPESINNACYDDGWVCKIKVSGSDSADALMDANAYDAYLKGI
jgi:glycine cleavage system H protein